MNDLFEQICKVVNPDNSGALEKSMDNFDTLHAELKEAINLLRSSRDHVLYDGQRELVNQIDKFLTKHS